MAQYKYDITSPQSLLEYAKGLSGKTLAEVVNMSQVTENRSNKGDLGKMVEKYYYGVITDDRTHEPDFPEAGVELKTTGVLKRKDSSYKAKERLVLTMINYVKLVNEKWETSSLMEKCSLMLLLFYLYEKDLSIFDRRFVLHPLLFKFPKEDLEIIRQDWETIRQKIEDGKAHELSEGDTYYLGACRKGSGGEKEKPRLQPNSDLPAKSRAFSLKQSYVNRIIEGHTSEVSALRVTADIGIEEATYNKFKPFLGKTVEEISQRLDLYKQGKNDKGFYRNITLRILGGRNQIVPELEKAEVEQPEEMIRQAVNDTQLR